MPTVVSAVKPSEICGTVPDSTGSICTKLKSLWSLANKMCTMATQFLNEDGSLSDDGISFFSGVAVPVGSIVFWPLDVAPSGWLVANGATISRTTYANLFNVYGTRYGAGDLTSTFVIPNLQRKFPFGSSGTNIAGSTGGSESSTLTMANLPASPPPLGSKIDALVVHKISGTAGTQIDIAGSSSPSFYSRGNSYPDQTDNALDNLGLATPVSILPPYLSGSWIIKF